MGKKVEGWDIVKRKYVVLTEDKLVSESSVFTVDPSTSFLTLFGENHGSDAEEALRQTAKQVTKKNKRERQKHKKSLQVSSCFLSVPRLEKIQSFGIKYSQRAEYILKDHLLENSLVLFNKRLIIFVDWILISP